MQIGLLCVIVKRAQLANSSQRWMKAVAEKLEYNKGEWDGADEEEDEGNPDGSM